MVQHRPLRAEATGGAYPPDRSGARGHAAGASRYGRPCGAAAPDYGDLGQGRTSRTWSPVSPRSPGRPSSSARTSREPFRPKSRISPGPRRSPPCWPLRDCRRSSCPAASSGSTRPAALAALDSIEPLQTRLVQVNYVTASSLIGSIGAILTKRGKVVADTTSNSLIVTDTRSRVVEVADFVKNLDIRTPQVSIQSKLIFVDRTDVQSLGLRYDLGSSDVFFNKLVQRTDPATGDPFDKNTVVVGGESVAGIANADALIVSPALEVVWRTAIGGFDLDDLRAGAAAGGSGRCAGGATHHHAGQPRSLHQRR